MSSYRDRVPLAHRAKGRWQSILPDLGVDQRHLTGKHTSCPMCGGKDRFRFDNKEGRGTWFCSQCGAGDGIKLALQVNGWDYKTAADKIEHLISAASLVEPKPDRPEEQKRAAMNRVWASSSPIESSDPAGKYLWSRARVSDFPTCLRFNPSVVFDHEQNLRHPAMIAKVTSSDGKPCMIHRTYLTLDGCNLRVEGSNARKVMSGSIPKGSAIRLMEHDKVLGIAEGIETAFAASKLFGVPVWAALNAGLLADWEAPEGVEEVIVFGDCDPGFAGQAAAFSLARRLAGKRGLRTSVHIPPTIGQDFNDVFATTINQETAQ